MNYLLTFLLAFLVLALANAKYDKLGLSKQYLDSLFKPEKYDPNIRPAGTNGSAVAVNVNIYIRSISNIDDVNMEYSAQLTFRQQWKDERLKYDDHRLDYIMLNDHDKIWMPDLFFSNERTAYYHNVMMLNKLIRIHPDGSVLYSARISMKLSCPMDLRNYPMDSQTCSIIMASYGYTTDDVIFNWKKSNPVQITKALFLPKFSLKKHYEDYCTSKTNTGEYSCLRIDLLFDREKTYHIIQTYISTTAIVLLSWVSLFLNHRCTTIRIAIWISALLAMIIRATTIASTTPAVSSTKAIDVWIGTCMTFIYCMLIELVIVINAVTAEDQKPTICMDDKTKELRTFTFIPLRWLNKYPSKAQRIDTVSCILFPAAFILFNFVYWLTYPVDYYDV